MSMNMNKLSERYDELWRETNALYEEWAKRRKISYHDLLVIISIAQSECPCTQKQICEQWFFPKQTIHSILQNFLKKGWIHFAPLESDRRNKQIIFTPEGEELAQNILNELEEHERRVWERIGARKSKVLLEYTALFNQYFKEEDQFENL